LALKKFGLYELNIKVCGAVLVIVYLGYLLFHHIKKKKSVYRQKPANRITGKEK